ncbi:hypothetical protein BSFA1_81940 (plasmid) [Burkholderia sp. SFA1]|nr:hypothetical protein BYI23_E003550 [Burkholderia sp. YI23]BBQ03066.1 hypothetical protein BSFA1_81940 [Burkholderia sp. SFA1]
MKKLAINTLTLSVALAHLLVANIAHAEDQASAPDSSVTVVTLRSEWRPVNGAITRNGDQPSHQPITIVDGGVKSAGHSCWKLSDTGQSVSVPGNCYMLRSAEIGETTPAR